MLFSGILDNRAKFWLHSLYTLTFWRYALHGFHNLSLPTVLQLQSSRFLRQKLDNIPTLGNGEKQNEFHSES